MKITILGSGTSTGIPEIGCTCEVCTSKDYRDNRMRASALVEVGEKRILIDCGPDFRAQMLTRKFSKIDAVLITHEHYDHVGGLDDLRPFCRFGEVPVYAEGFVVDRLLSRMPYCFVENKYPGVPNICLKPVDPTKPFYVDGVEIIPLRAVHGSLPVLGYRIGNMAYITDMSVMPEESYELLKGVEYLIMNALRIQPHFTHQCLDEAIKNATRVSSKETYFIHMSHHMGLHAEMEKKLPSQMHFAFDGMEVNF